MRVCLSRGGEVPGLCGRMQRKRLENLVSSCGSRMPWRALQSIGITGANRKEVVEATKKQAGKVRVIMNLAEEIRNVQQGRIVK